MTETVFFITELIGTIAFAVSGAMAGIEKKMDIFGVTVLAMTTAVGGGIFRDLLLGITPPSVFRDPFYVIVSVATVLVLLPLLCLRRTVAQVHKIIHSSPLLDICDAVGLGAFCVIGADTAIQVGFDGQIFLLVFVGTITGVGGGILRDIMSQQTPIILCKRIYAVAAIAGSWLFVFLRNFIPNLAAMFCGWLFIVLLRLLSMYFHWNLPILPNQNPPKR